MSVTPSSRSSSARAIALWLLPVCLLSASISPEKRTEALQNAASLIQQSNLAPAEELLQGLLKQDAADAVALNLLGFIRMQQQRTADAEAMFLRAIRAGRGIPGPHINLARLYGAERPFAAIEHLRIALDLAPGSASAESSLRGIAKSAALASSHAAKPNEAFEILRQAQAVLPHDPELLYDRGMLALETGDAPLARSSFEEALQFLPEYPEAHYGLARAELKQNLAAQAERQMRLYLTARPDDATAHYGLGYILMAEQKPSEAQQEFERSLTLQPSQTESWFQLGEIAFEQDQRNLAEERYRKVLSTDPLHAGALTGLAMLSYRASRFDEARVRCEQAIAAAPDYQKAHYYYALALARLGRKPEADREFAVARQLQKPHDAGAVGGMGALQ